MRPRIRLRQTPLAVLAVLGFALAPGPIRASAPSDEFFIVSSVDAAKGTMILKRPTEVTLVMHVTPKTRCWSEAGGPIQFTDLRAGDTVFIVAQRDGPGRLLAITIRRGVMTVPELRKRYFGASRL